MTRLVLLSTSPSVPPGTLTLAGWDVLRAGSVFAGDPAHPQLRALAAAGIEVRILAADNAAELAKELVAATADDLGVWLLASDGDDAFVNAVEELGEAAVGEVEVETVVGSDDPVGAVAAAPGRRLLDAVAVMDRLRSPGGCPWDAEQTHASLARYLLEEAYEAYEALEDEDSDALREELGDVLLQVLFHARLAAERTPEDGGWDIDDLAGGLVDKLVRRHPHVFDTEFDRASVRGAEDVEANWDTIKATEKVRTSITDGVALGQPALSLAAKLQSRAARADVPADLVSPALGSAATPAQAVSGVAAQIADDDLPPESERVGELLFAAVALARTAEVDPEAALRGAARRFRDRLVSTEAAARRVGLDPDAFGAADWRDAWAEEDPASPLDDDDGEPSDAELDAEATAAAEAAADEDTATDDDAEATAADDDAEATAADNAAEAWGAAAVAELRAEVDADDEEAATAELLAEADAEEEDAAELLAAAEAAADEAAAAASAAAAEAAGAIDDDDAALPPRRGAPGGGEQ